MSRKEQIEKLEVQIISIQKEIEALKAVKEVYVVVVRASADDNWYNVGDVCKVVWDEIPSRHGFYYPLVANKNIGIGVDHCIEIVDADAIAALDNALIAERT